MTLRGSTLSWPRPAQYALALAVILLALVLRGSLNPVLDRRVPFITVFAAMLVLVMLVRAGPFLVASAAGLLGVYLLVEPRGRAIEPTLAEAVELGLFALAVAAAVLAAWLSRRVKEAATASEERFARAFDTSPVVFAITTPHEGRFLEVNTAFESALGYSREELVGRSSLDIGLWADPARRRALIDELAAQRRVRDTEVVLRTKAGELRTFVASAVPIEFAGQSCVMTCGVDITERKRVEQELWRRTEELRVVTDAMPALISYVGADGCYGFVNKSYLEWFGRPAERIVGRHLRDVLGPAAYERIAPFVATVLAGRRCRYEIEVPYRDAGTRRVLAEYVPDVKPDGTVAGFYALVTDVTQSRHAEQAQAHLAAIVENSDDAIIGKSLDGRIRTWNAGAERLFGWSAGEIVGRSIDLIIPPDRQDEERAMREHVRRGERNAPFDTVRQARDGRLLDVSVSLSPIRDATGEIIGSSMVARDITERKRAEQAMRSAARKKDEFLATLAHELRNPLAAIRSAIEVMLRRPEATQAQLERMTDIVQRQVALMVRLIDDLLDVNRITRGTFALRTERVGLEGLLRQAADVARPWLERDQHRLTIESTTEPLELQGDAVRLVQVFGNVLSNACKYTEPGGTIRIRTQRQGDQAVVRIQDNGAGIPPDKLESIFEMFSQLDTAPRNGEVGLGIGLALSRRLVELHGGSMTAASAGPGKGSEFTIRLPLGS